MHAEGEATVHTRGSCSYSVRFARKWLSRYTPPVECTTVYCIPGGRGSEVLRKPVPRSLTRLRTTIVQGGVYIGICCGAYLACREIRFDDTLCTSGLGLVNAVAIGPKFQNGERYDYNSPLESRIVPITDTFSQQQVAVFYRGGGVIQPTAGLHVEATFEDGDPCVLSGRVANGVVILSSVHPEHPDSSANLIFDRVFSKYGFGITHRL